MVQVIKILDELDAIRLAQRKAAKKRNSATRQVNLSRRSLNPPEHPIYPFMLNAEWHATFTAENPNIVVEVHPSDPDGYEDGL